MRLFIGLGRRIMLALFLAGLVLSPNAYAAVRLLWMAGEGAIAEYRLQLVPPERYAAEIEAALAARDADLARSLAHLADDRRVALPEPLRRQVAALPGLDLVDLVGQGWDCVVGGQFESEAGFACVVATDLTGIGDVRDLAAQGGNYLTGQPVDYFTLGIATVGLGLTAATLGTGGMALPLRAGASFLKAANKVGRLPPRLAAEIGGVLARSINRSALDEAMVLARELRLAELQRPLARLFDPQAAARIGRLADDFGRIGAAGGVRAMKLGVETADSTRDVARLARTADRYEDRFLGVMKLLGKGAIRLLDLAWTIGGWLVAALLWAWSGLGLLLSLTTRAARLAGRLLVRSRP